MSLQINLLEAQNGECIWLRYGEERHTNIIIDSGPASFERGFRDLLKKIGELGEEVDLMILTHIDDDHIKGLAKNIMKPICKIIKEVWLNGDSVIDGVNQTHSVNNIGSLVEAIRENNYNLTAPILRGKKIEINGAVITVINPVQSSIEYVADKIACIIPHTGTPSYSQSIDELLQEDKFIKDGSDTNKASIAVVFSYKNKNIAFLGDAHAEDIIEGKELYFENVKMDYVKLAHHGSKYNTSDELIRCLASDKYMVCKRKYIDKETVARIANINNNAVIYGNYKWWESVSYFKEGDKTKYLDTKVLELICNRLIDIDVDKKGE